MAGTSKCLRHRRRVCSFAPRRSPQSRPANEWQLWVFSRKRATGAMPRLGRRPFAPPHGCCSEAGQVRPRAASRRLSSGLVIPRFVGGGSGSADWPAFARGPAGWAAATDLLHWRFNLNVAGIGVLHFPDRTIKPCRDRKNLVRRQSCLPIHQDRAPGCQLLPEPRQIRFLGYLPRGINNYLSPCVIVITCSVTGISPALERDCSKTFKSRLRGPESAAKGVLVYPAVALEPGLVLAHPCPFADPY